MASKNSERRIRAVSKALFGSGARLRAGAFIADHDAIYARQVADAIEVAENEAGRELKHFSNAGLLAPPTGAPGGRRRQIYRRRDSTFWELAKELLREIEKPRQ
jgi:hypothetical protein